MKPTSYHAFHDPDDPVRIKDVILEGLDDGLSHDEILQIVSRRFPRAQTSIRNIRFYAWKRRREAGETQPYTPRGLIREAIMAGFADPEVLELVRAEMPTARTTVGSIATARSILRNSDPTIPTSRQALRLRGLA